MATGEWVYSDDEERYPGGDGCATREEAIAEALSELDLQPGQSFWTGRKRPPNVACAIDVEHVVEHLGTLAADDDPTGDFSNDWMPFPAKDSAKRRELADICARFCAEVDGWVAKYDPPTWFIVEDAKEHIAPTPPATTADEPAGASG